MRLDEDGLRGILSDADGVLATDGQGHVLARHGQFANGTDVAPGLDLALAALREVGARQTTGTLEVAMLTFRERTLVVAVHPTGGHVAVLASASVKPGLLLSHVKRLVGSDDPVRAGGRS